MAKYLIRFLIPLAVIVAGLVLLPKGERTILLALAGAILDEDEPLIRLAEVPKLKWLPGRRGGRRLNVSTVFRWAQVGIKGVRLEAVKIGGTLCTSEPALKRFFERLTDPKLDSEALTPSQIRKQHKQAERQLSAAKV
jgi:hypothetical protein